MNICILGPEITKDSFGGIATFNEGLKNAFNSLGHKVLIISNSRGSKNFFRKSNFIHPSASLKKVIKDFDPDLIITSMWYGLINNKIQKICPKVKTIHFIHGFPNYRYGIVKKNILNVILKNIRKKTDLFIANSKLTKLINNEIYGIECDKVIELGLQESYKDFLKKPNNEIKFIFVGRIVEEKKVDKICEVFNHITENNNNKCSLTIVGEGPEKEYLKNKYSSSTIFFEGKASRENVMKKLQEADIFISLNPHEPFGLVFLEAVLNKCKIICPDSGGQLEFLNELKENVMSIDLNDYKNSKYRFDEFLKIYPYEKTDLRLYFEKYNYKRVADEILQSQYL
ncbi:glycosyltransferase family 4 protein [Exiguobacterium sp. s91]|uniref:glycosyltransferase family 4 protein n=1 Tax=Exiguobacterium sp. s91 TaxID=2751199 RepID=UPI001BEA0285|nr:glycosyltransferase family 4 protein [Exiguobacterium sp. s91]